MQYISLEPFSLYNFLHQFNRTMLWIWRKRGVLGIHISTPTLYTTQWLKQPWLSTYQQQLLYILLQLLFIIQYVGNLHLDLQSKTDWLNRLGRSSKKVFLTTAATCLLSRNCESKKTFPKLRTTLEWGSATPTKVKVGISPIWQSKNPQSLSLGRIKSEAVPPYPKPIQPPDIRAKPCQPHLELKDIIGYHQGTDIAHPKAADDLTK